MKFCIVVTILAGDSGAEIRNLFGLPVNAGITGLKDYVIGRDKDQSGEFGRWVLAYNGVPVTFTNPRGNQEEIEVVMLIAYNSNVNQTIRNRIGEMAINNPTIIRQLEFNPPLTRPQMAARLKVEVGQEIAASKYWHAKPGDDVTTGITSGATLQAKFLDLPQ